MRARATRLVLASCVVVAAQLAVGATPTDPWATVPAFPTGCYSGQDDFAQRIDAAMQTLSADIERQKESNSKVSDAVANLDPMEKQRRMQTYLMAHPQDAMKIMQAPQGAGVATEDLARASELDTQLRDLFARYDAALRDAWAPMQAKLATLNDGEGATQRDYDEAAAAHQQSNAAYERLCGSWWKTGPLRDWLGAYKAYLVEQIPKQQALDDAGNAMWVMFGVSTAGYRSTAAPDAVLKYMKRAEEVFGKREAAPIPLE